MTHSAPSGAGRATGLLAVLLAVGCATAVDVDLPSAREDRREIVRGSDAGGRPTPPAAQPDCTSGEDCESRVCASGRCAEPSCDDGVQNGEETGVDCGGPDCCACDERCNGHDDDCDGVVDNGCPVGTFVDAEVWMSIGSGGIGGSPFHLACGSDQVLTGFDITYSTGSRGEIRQLRPHCSTLSLEAVWREPEHVFEVRTRSPVSLAVAGGTPSGSSANDRCPPDQVVIGLTARVADGEVRRFGFTCGSVTASRPERGAPWALRVSPPAHASPERGRGEGSGTFWHECPAGSVGTVLAGRSGNRIDQVALGCSRMTLETVCGAADVGGAGCPAGEYYQH